MKKIINVLLTILLCLGCFTINVSALEETTSETQDVINDEDVLDVDSENIAPDPIIEDTENEIVVADETVVEDEGADIVESIEPQETAETQKYSLTVVYSFDDEYTTTLDLTSYKPGEYGFLVSTTDGYVTREVEEETKYYYIDSININSEPVADDKIEINEDDNGNQEYLYLMSEEDVTITVLFSSKKDTESAEYTTEPACYQDGDGNIVLSLGDSYKNSLIQEVKFSASDGSYYRQIFGNEQYDLIDGTITIPYSQIEHSNLKQGLTYQIRLQIDSNYVDFPSSLSLITGSKKKDAPDYNVVQNENGDIVLTCSDEYSVLQIEIISFIGQSFESIDFFGSMLIYKNNTVTIPYKNIKNSQLVEGEYDVQVSFDASKYIYNPLKKPITIYLGSKPTALPDFNIYQEDDGTLVVSSENSDLLDAISKVGYILNNAHHIFNSNEFTIEENKVKIPYENIANSSLLSNKKTTFYITLKSGGLFVCDFDDLKKEVLIKKGSIAEYLSARQEDNGDIIIEMEDNNILNDISSIPFSVVHFIGRDYNDEKTYNEFFGNNNAFSDNILTIPYNLIEYSNVKPGLKYYITLKGDLVDIEVPSELLINKGSMKKDAPDYSVSQNDKGDIVFTFDDADFVSGITTLYFNHSRFDKWVNFLSDDLIREKNTVTISYNTIKKSQLTKGDYYTSFGFDNQHYYDNYPSKSIDITLGSELSALPEFDIYQEDDGNLVITSESGLLLESIDCINYDVGDYYYSINNDKFILEENKIVIPYNSIIISNLAPNNTYSFRMHLKSDDIFLYENSDLYKDVLIKKGSIVEYLSARQEDNGDIIIEISDNILENLEDTSLKYVNFSGTDESNGRNYRYAFYNDKYVILGNTITIPYRFIENSSLKQGLEYQISLKSESNYINLPSELLLNKGSIKKDAPDYSVLQNENGDIVLHSDDSDFLDIVTDISIYGKNSVSFGKQNFVYSSNDRIITIPYKVIEKSQLIEGKYNVDVYYEGMYTDNSPYFDNIPTKSVTITLGSTLPTLPDFNIHQEDNGDIVLYSESEELISQICEVYYWESNNQRAGGPAFFEDSFIIDKNTITIPYFVVLLSQLESNKNHHFSIGLRSQDIYLYDYETTNREVYINKGSITEYLSVRQDEEGNVIIEMDENGILDCFEDLSIDDVYFSCSDETNGRYYSQSFYDNKYVMSGNTITIPYSQIEYSNLKQGLEYQISLWNESVNGKLPTRLLLNKGSKRKDPPDYSVLQNENGDIVFSFDDANFVPEINYIHFSGTKRVEFYSDNLVYNNGTITIPYKVIEKSQLIEAKYNVYVHYDGMYTDNSPYFDNIPTKSVTITLGSTLPTLPDFNIHQEDNGDIVLYSESEELISQIRRVYYWESNNQRAGSPGFDEKAFFVDKNTITIPYQVVKYSWIEGNKTYVFGIILKNDVFLTNDSNTEKEVFIKLGSLVFDKPYLNICTDYVGAVSIKFDSQEELNKLDNGEYQLNYLLYDCNEKETEIKRDSLVFDYTNKMVYIVTNLESGEDYRINLVKGEEIIASGTYYVNSTPVIDQEALSQNINEEKLLYYANAYYDSLYPNANFNILSIGIYTDVVQDADIDKYFNIYSLSDSNSLILDISLYPTGISGDVDYSKIPYDRPGEYIKLELSASLEQMSKLGITKDNYTQNEIVVLREHNGKVDELEAKLEPVIVSGTIISFKVKFETDKMSLFAIANKVSVIKPSTGSIGGSSTRKPVVNTSAK